MSKVDQIRALRESRDKRRFSKGAVVTKYLDPEKLKVKTEGLRIKPLSTTPAVGDGVSLTSTSHPVKKKQSAKAKRRSGRPLNSERDKTLTATKPWEALGMSRRTWFRRQAAERAKARKRKVR